MSGFRDSVQNLVESELGQGDIFYRMFSRYVRKTAYCKSE